MPRLTARSRTARAAVPLALLLWAWALTGVGAESGAGPVPPAQPASSAAPPASRPAGDLVGAAVCAECHEEVHEAWSGARHSRMIQRASRASVVGDFRQTDLRLHGDPFRLRAADGAFYITESRWSGAPVEHKVELTLGSRRIQHYLTTVDHGRIVVLPPAWDVERKAWFDSVEIIRPDEGDTQVVQQWNKNCVGCHVSEQDNRYDPATKTYATTWRDEGTTCERCHGPGREHVERYRAAAGQAPPGPTGIVRATRLTPARSTAVCAQCHSLRDRAAPGFRAGEAYDDYFVLKLEYTPRKEQDPVYWADGRPRRFSNDAAGFWQSQCYLRGGATCVTCHDPHAPNVDRHAELAPANTALCTRCHEAIGRDVAAHTKHPAASAGSACVDCHMPREVVSIKARIRDHTIGVPTPENTVKYGIPNACTTCHTTKSAAWAVDRMAAWWPDGRRRRNVARATAFSEGRAASPEALPKLVALTRDPAEGPLSRANALGYLRAYDDPGAVAALGDALASDEPLLRMVAASSVTQPALQPGLLRALGDASRSVRLAALVSLVNLGTPVVTPGDTVRFRSVSREFAAQAAEHEDDAATQTDLGLVHLLNGRLEPASTALSIALDLSPKFPGAAFFLGLVRLGQQRPDDARRLLARVPATDPFYATARARLKQLDAQERR
ncbi:MAG: ammonia-forming cytochrome c nitrite reductase subunit c552 [Vicinamibacterales bacterium]